MAEPAQEQDPTSLHDLAVDAQTDLQKLATGLAHAGANPQAVQQLTKMSEVLAGVVKVLGQGPAVEQAAQQGAAPTGQQGPPQAQPQPPQGAPAPPGEAPHAPTLQAAAQGLHAMMQQAAQQRATQAR